MKNDVVVTIICLAYNHGKYIEKALNGFLMQKTDFKYEVIVHDDASTDNTTEIIKNYYEKYPDIIKPIFQKENIYGSSKDAIVDFIIPRISGKYIALCEGDDYWTDEYKLQLQYDVMESISSCSLVVHGSYTLVEDKNYYKDNLNVLFGSRISKIDTDTFFNYFTNFPTNSLFFKSKFLLDNVDFFREVPLYDYVMKIMLALNGDVYCIADKMSVYRLGSEGSWTVRSQKDNQTYAKHIRNSIENIQKIKEYMGDEDKRLLKLIAKRELMLYQLEGNKLFFTNSIVLQTFLHESTREKLIFVMRLYFPRFFSVVRNKILPTIRKNRRLEG